MMVAITAPIAKLPPPPSSSAAAFATVPSQSLSCDSAATTSSMSKMGVEQQQPKLLSQESNVNKESNISPDRDASISSQVHSSSSPSQPSSPPPLKFIDIDPNQRLPRPPPPSSNADDSDLMKRAEEMIHWAISSKHENSPATIAAASTSTNNSNHMNDTQQAIRVREQQQQQQQQQAILRAAQAHKSLTTLLSRKSSTPLLLATLHSLVTSNSGRNLDKLVTNSKVHAQIFHLIMKFDPFLPPSASSSGSGGMSGIGSGGIGNEGNGVVVGLDKLRELDRVRHERRKAEASDNISVVPQSTTTLTRTPSTSTITNPTPRKAKIAEPSIRHKENQKYLSPILPYLSYSIADAHLHLLVTLVSNNSILSMSAIRSVWSLLTEFGGRWMEWCARSLEEERKERRRERQLRVKERQGLLEEKGAEKMGEAEGQPPAKRIKTGCASSPASKPSASTSAVSVEDAKKLSDDKNSILQTPLQQQKQPENEKPVPGMAGLSVEFVRDAFYFCNSENKNDGDGNHAYVVEEIFSDRLASGRVHRLLLTILNIIRLCPRSKSSLQHEISHNFPHHKTAPPALYRWYTHTCLQMVHLIPTLEGPVLSLFVDKALDMDVEIKIGEGGRVILDGKDGREDEGSGLEDMLDGIDGSGGGQHQASSLCKKRTFQQISQGATAADKVNNGSIVNHAATLNGHPDDEADHIFEISERLDTLMTLLYEHILKVTTYDATSLPSAMSAVVNARRLYRHLDEVFDRKVRTTDRSKFVQFAFFVLFGRENDALECVGRLMAEREQQQEQQLIELEKQKEQADKSNNDTSVQCMTKDEMDIMATNTLPTTTTTNSNAGPINIMDPLYRSFSAKLINFFFNPSHAGDVPRQTVVCYLASFVSRATYVCPETVCECVAALLRWAEVYISAQQQSTTKNGIVASASSSSSAGVNGGGNIRRVSSAHHGNTQHPCEIHALFYTACQAAFYMMCFRGAEALKYYRAACRHANDPDSPYADPDSVDIGPARWKALCGHNGLQPLKYCLESVRMEFLHLAEDLDLFLETASDDGDGGSSLATRREEAKKFLEQLWTTSSPGSSKKQATSQGHIKAKSSTTTAPKKRKRSRITIISTAATQEKKRLDGGVGGLGRGSNPLNSFFPFDPYLLQKSYRHVDPYYRNWEDCILTLEEDDGGDDGENGNVQGVACDGEDAHSDISDMEEEEEEDEDSDGHDDDDDDDEDEYDDRSKEPTKSVQKASPTTTAATGLVSLQEDNHFEMEIRRSRAMSTGSQCSW